MKKLTKKQRAEFYLKCAELEYNNLSTNSLFPALTKCETLQQAEDRFPELILVTGDIYEFRFDLELIRDTRVYALLFCHELAKN